jgi:hypothetical protein
MTTLTQPAYPVMPIQDNFKRLVVPVPGITKLEHFALELFKNCYQDVKDGAEARVMQYCIDDAITFLNLLEEKTKTLNNEKSNEMAIFNS